jgi:hypothetical protein
LDKRSPQQDLSTRNRWVEVIDQYMAEAECVSLAWQIFFIFCLIFTVSIEHDICYVFTQ